MFFLNFVSFLYPGNSSTYIDLRKKSDRTRCLAVSILEYNINSNSKSAERAKAFWFSEGRTKLCSDSSSEHRRPGLSNSLNQWTFMTCK